MRIRDWSSDGCSSDLSNSALGSAIGGTAADNTMAAFLAQRGSNDLAATLAGVRASATQTAAEIARGNVATEAGVNQNTAGTVAEIGNLLKGAPTTTSQESLEEELAALVGRQTDRKSVVAGKRVRVRVDLGGRRKIKKKTQGIEREYKKSKK